MTYVNKLRNNKYNKSEIRKVNAIPNLIIFNDFGLGACEQCPDLGTEEYRTLCPGGKVSTFRV